MKVYEVLATSRFLLATMNRNGVSADDIMYLDMFYEYRDMLAEGRKEAEIRAFLSNKYKLSASTIKKAIKRLNEEYII
jgi:transposase